MSDTAREGYLTLAKQTAQGTPAVAVTTGWKHTSNDLGGVSENLDADAEVGGSRAADADLAALGAFHVAGTVESYARFQNLGYWLLGLGFVQSGAPVALADGGYEHTFVPGSFTWLTLETAWGKNRAIRRFTDCLVDTLELSLDAGDRVTMSTDIVGLGEAWQASPSTPVWATPDPTGTFLGSAVILDGLGTYRLGDMSVSVENNLSDDEVIVGARTNIDITPGSRATTFSGTLKLNPAEPGKLLDLYRAALYGSKTATSPQDGEPYHTTATLTFGSPRRLAPAGTPRFGLDAIMPDVVLSAFPLESSGDDIIEASIEGTAYDNGIDPDVTFKLRNLRSTAY